MGDEFSPWTPVHGLRAGSRGQKGDFLVFRTAIVRGLVGQFYRRAGAAPQQADGPLQVERQRGPTEFGPHFVETAERDLSHAERLLDHRGRPPIRVTSQCVNDLHFATSAVAGRTRCGSRYCPAHRRIIA